MKASTVAVGEAVRHERRRKGISLNQAAAKADVSAPFLSDFERGNRTGKPETIIRIALAVGIKPATLLGLIRDALVADVAAPFDEAIRRANAFATKAPEPLKRRTIKPAVGGSRITAKQARDAARVKP